MKFVSKVAYVTKLIVVAFLQEFSNGWTYILTTFDVSTEVLHKSKQMIKSISLRIILYVLAENVLSRITIVTNAGFQFISSNSWIWIHLGSISLERYLFDQFTPNNTKKVLKYSANKARHHEILFYTKTYVTLTLGPSHIRYISSILIISLLAVMWHYS